MAFSFGNFGQQNQPAQQNKPSFSFGAPAAQQPAAPTSAPSFSFGNPSTTAPAAQPSTSLFGQPSQQQQQQGQAGQAPAGQAGGTSLFGGGFGASTSQQTQQQQPAPAGGFSFGGFGAKPAGTTPGTTPAPTGGLFGNTQPQQQQQQPSFGFGASSSTNAQPTQGLSFGASASTSQPIQQNQNQNATSTSTAPITKSTRFEDLPEPARKMIEEMESYIQGRIAIQDSLKADKLGAEIEETSHTLRQLSNEFSALSNHLAHDSRYTADLRSRFEQSLRDAVKAVQIVDAFRAPVVTQPGQPPSQPSKPHPAFLQEFFRRKAEELTRRLATYKSSIEQIQGQLSRTDPDQVKAILPTLRAQHSATLQLASKLSSLEHGTTELKDEYRDLWREKTGSVRDPFIERRREVLGTEAAVVDSVGGLSIR